MTPSVAAPGVTHPSDATELNEGARMLLSNMLIKLINVVVSNFQMFRVGYIINSRLKSVSVGNRSNDNNNNSNSISVFCFCFCLCFMCLMFYQFLSV